MTDALQKKPATWHRIRIATLQKRLHGARAWAWEARTVNGRKRLGLRGASGRFVWFKMNGGAFVRRATDE